MSAVISAIIDVTRLSACGALLTGFLAFVSANTVSADTVHKQGAATALAPQTVTMMTYNIQQLGYPNWLANHFEKPRLQLIPEAIKALSKRPDVLILQEVFTEHAFDFLVNKMTDVYPFHTERIAKILAGTASQEIAGLIFLRVMAAWLFLAVGPSSNSTLMCFMRCASVSPLIF